MRNKQVLKYDLPDEEKWQTNMPKILIFITIGPVGDFRINERLKYEILYGENQKTFH